MEELLKRITGMGITLESWILSFVAATLLAIYRIYEPEVAPSPRKRVSIMVMGLISALLIPGLVVYWLKIDNAFIAASVTAVVVYSFEQVLQTARTKVLRKINDNADSNGTTA